MPTAIVYSLIGSSPRKVVNQNFLLTSMILCSSNTIKLFNQAKSVDLIFLLLAIKFIYLNRLTFSLMLNLRLMMLKSKRISSTLPQSMVQSISRPFQIAKYTIFTRIMQPSETYKASYNCLRVGKASLFALNSLFI